MYFLNELDYMHIYRRKFSLPINMKNKKKSSCVFLLAPNLDSSIHLLNNPIISKKYFNSYFIERNAMYYINQEGYAQPDEYDVISEATYLGWLHEDYTIKQSYARIKLEDKQALMLFNESVNNDIEIINEANASLNSSLKKILYKERFRTPKEVIQIYDRVKHEVPYIKHTYLSIDKYKNSNLFVDLSSYSENFFKTNMFKLKKAAELYFELVSRFLNDNRFNIYKCKCVLVPLNDYIKQDTDIFDYNSNINPLSVILYMLRFNTKRISELSNLDFVFLYNGAYIKLNFINKSKKDINPIKLLFTRMMSKAPMQSDDEDEKDDNVDSPTVIKSKIIDALEKNKGIKINNLSGDSGEKTKDDLIDKIDNAAASSSDVDSTLDKMENDKDIKQILADLETNNSEVKISAARTTRLKKLNDEFLEKKVNNEKVKDYITTNSKMELPKTDLKIDSPNEEWHDMRSMNFKKAYNLEADVYSIFESFSDKDYPIVVRNIEVEDTSTTEDYIDTYTVQFEDSNGKRFKINIDIPKLEGNEFMRIGGNTKTINGQLMLLPISKTDEDTVQIVSNYKKIFIRRYGSTGKATVCSDRIIKALNREGHKIKTVYGNNNKLSLKYNLPIDYIDLGAIYSKLIVGNYTIYFNQDEIHELYDIDDSKGIPIAYNSETKTVSYVSDGWLEHDTVGKYILELLCSNDDKFREIYDNTKVSSKYCYSKASILNNEIPLIVIMAYHEGLIRAMNVAHIKYELTEKRPTKYDPDKIDYIKFNDGYVVYNIDYNSSLLMNGLKECDTDNYSIKQINSKPMYLDFLDNYGGRILSDGLDNFYQLMIDPQTKEVLIKYKLPTTYMELLAYSNLLLADNKYIEHTSLKSNRYRSNEIIAGYLYQELSKAYGDYRTQLKKGKTDATVVIKKTAVIDALMADPTSGDMSTLNALNEFESLSAVGFKGLAGMNSDRGYGLDKRIFDKSMVNILGAATGFAGNVGITRQATVDMNIEGRGYLKIEDNPKMSTTKSFTATELLTPFGPTRDDSMRTAMNFIQTSKHGMRIENGVPQLVTTGMDQALPYMITDTFAFKSKEAGKVIKKTDNYMIIKYKSGRTDFVDLRDNVQKNSNGGFFTSIKLDTNLKEGSSFKENEILAYDRSSFSNKIGDQKEIAYILGAFKKIAIMSSAESFEDSAIISEQLSQDLASDVIFCVDVLLPKNTNILSMVEKGQPIQEGEPLVIFQNAFEEEDVNSLLKNLSDDESAISDLGRISIKSKVTGTVHDIKIYRTVDKDQLSDSIKKQINKLEKNDSQMIKDMKQYGLNYKRYDTSQTLNTTGKLKNAEDSVYIEFYLKYHDVMSVGDKLIYFSALKGVVQDIFKEGEEPYTDYRPDEPVESILSIASINARMTGGILMNGGINKVLVELDRHIKDIVGLPYTKL